MERKKTTEIRENLDIFGKLVVTQLRKIPDDDAKSSAKMEMQRFLYDRRFRRARSSPSSSQSPLPSPAPSPHPYFHSNSVASVQALDINSFRVENCTCQHHSDDDCSINIFLMHVWKPGSDIYGGALFYCLVPFQFMHINKSNSLYP